MLWLFFALSTVVLFTILNLLQRKIGIESKDPRATAVIFNLVCGAIALLVFLLTGSFRGLTLPTQPSAWIFLLFAIACYGLFERGRFYAAKLLEAGIFDTILTISLVISFFGAVIFYHEALTLFKVLGAGAILAALLLTTYDPKQKITSRTGVIIGITVSILLGLAWLVDKQNIMSFSPTLYSLFVWTLPVLFIIFPGIKMSSLRQEIKVGSWKVFLLAGINVVGYLGQLHALALAGETRTLPVIQTSVLFTTVLAIFVLQEKENIPRKIIGALLAVVGVLLLI
jgi:drug/metabolite transporter (DMT)-like permease